MIHIEKPSVKVDGGEAKLSACISIDGNREEVWFKVDKKYEQYLCYERCDAFLILVLNYAMRNGHDITSDAPIGEHLYYNINTYLIDALCEYNAHFYRTQINADIDSSILPSAGAVGTGVSCGVDSLYAMAMESEAKFPHHKLTHLMFNNVGSHGEGERARVLFESRKERPLKIATELGYEVIFGDSNVMDVIKQSHYFTHTYSSMFAVFCLQKLFSTYFYASSAAKYHEFSLVDNGVRGPGSYELLSLRCFSTNQLTIHSQGESKSRMQKLSIVVDYSPAYEHLHVCLVSEKNCGTCEKCVRTLLGIDALGKIDAFGKAFDREYYKTNKGWYLQQLMYRRADGKHDYFELYDYFKQDITLWMRIKTVIYQLRSFTRNILSKNEKLYRFLREHLKK